jgi:hypothetical protein
MAHGHPVNMLRTGHCSETDVRFQPTGGNNRRSDSPRDGSWEYTGNGSQEISLKKT